MGQQITMNMQIIQLLALAGIAIYLILKLRGVLGTRDGHEGPRANIVARADDRPKLEVIDLAATLDGLIAIIELAVLFVGLE